VRPRFAPSKIVEPPPSLVYAFAVAMELARLSLCSVVAVGSTPKKTTLVHLVLDDGKLPSQVD
jgi:hypothetical protein